jgi:hypothetical protein
MVQDAWTIYGNSGLLELNLPGHQDFTVTDSQYGIPVKDNQGVLTQFSINPGQPLVGNTYVINENGILVGSQGLHIINNSGASRIVFQSVGDDLINLLGSIQVNNNPAELVFITPYKLNCNGCNFPGVSKVTFCTIPSSSPLPNYLLQNDPSTYCTDTSSKDDLLIGNKGLPSTSVNMFVYASKPKFSGAVSFNSLVLKSNGETYLKDVYVINNADITSIGKITIGDLKSTKNIDVKSSELISIWGLVKANELVKLTSKDIGNHGAIESSKNIELYCDNGLWVNNNIKAENNIKSIVGNVIAIGKGGSISSKGDFLVQNPQGGVINSFSIESGKLEVKKDATIKANSLNVYRSGNIIASQPIPEAAQGSKPWDGKWAIAMNCHKEILADNTGPESKVLIGGTLTFEGSKIENSLSKFNIGGSRVYKSATPTIIEHAINLRIVGNFGTECKGSWGPGPCVAEAKARMARYCGIHFSEDKYGKDQVVYQLYNTITSPIYDHSSSVMSEIAAISTVQEVSTAYHNHHKQPFNDYNQVHHTVPAVAHQPTQQASAANNANNLRQTRETISLEVNADGQVYTNQQQGIIR